MLARAARETVHAIEPGPAAYSAQPLTDALSATLSQQQFRTLLVGAFSALALTLATSGLYGVMTCSVSLRTRQSVFGWLWELHGHQLGELRGDVCHRIFCSTEAGSRAEQGADCGELRTSSRAQWGRVVTRQECRKLFVGYALSL